GRRRTTLGPSGRGRGLSRTRRPGGAFIRGASKPAERGDVRPGRSRLRLLHLRDASLLELRDPRGGNPAGGADPRAGTGSRGRALQRAGPDLPLPEHRPHPQRGPALAATPLCSGRWRAPAARLRDPEGRRPQLRRLGGEAPALLPGLTPPFAAASARVQSGRRLRARGDPDPPSLSWPSVALRPDLLRPSPER